VDVFSFPVGASSGVSGWRWDNFSFSIVLLALGALVFLQHLFDGEVSSVPSLSMRIMTLSRVVEDLLGDFFLRLRHRVTDVRMFA